MGNDLLRRRLTVLEKTVSRDSQVVPTLADFYAAVRNGADLNSQIFRVPLLKFYPPRKQQGSA